MTAPVFSKANNKYKYVHFSNGNLDPWSGLGVLEKPSPSIVTVMIDQGAHHLDLRKSNPLDPESVKKAREIEKENIRVWVSQKNQ